MQYEPSLNVSILSILPYIFAVELLSVRCMEFEAQCKMLSFINWVEKKAKLEVSSTLVIVKYLRKSFTISWQQQQKKEVTLAYRGNQNSNWQFQAGLFEKNKKLTAKLINRKLTFGWGTCLIQCVLLIRNGAVDKWKQNQVQITSADSTSGAELVFIVMTCQCGMYNVCMHILSHITNALK